MNTYVEKIISILMREYELHRKELLLQIQLYNRQTQYIQLYGALLLGLLAFITGSYPEWLKSLVPKGLGGIGTEAKPQEYFLNELILLVLLVLAAFIAFYLVSAVMASSYLFLVIRRRMAQIEQKINCLLRSPDLLVYETYVTPHFLENSRYGTVSFTPHFLSTIWRIILFACIILILSYFANILLPKRPSSLWYSIGIAALAIFQVGQYAWLYYGGKKNIDAFYGQPFQPRGPQRYTVQAFLLFFVFCSIFFLVIILYPFYPNLLKNIYHFPINFFKNTYLIFVNSSTIQLNYWSVLFYIFIYQIACAIFWPTPSEAPLLLLYKSFSLLTIIAVSAIGKGFGSYIVFIGSDIIKKLFKLSHLKPVFLSKQKIEDCIKTKGFIAYFLMQAIPFMPMRSSILIYSFISRSGAKVAIGAAIGTVFRNLLMLLLVWLGYLSIKALFGV